MRDQLLEAGIGALDAVVYTHSHADHMHGIDDLRQITYRLRARIPVWADGPTQDALLSRFGYAFVQPDGSSYPPICDLHTIRGPATVEGAGGAITACTDTGGATGAGGAFFSVRADWSSESPRGRPLP